ncbi:hypothetical protein [Thalassoroseus pseudoceratinae]|uniref:hypothetical protein n=1 Tax=Thalassoroseus pseudoceratinae TaxID=2713176 RepID=UPI00141FAA65|nr:hypothetical protein [Thalassoroseus pseudoceratinae]
MPQEKPNKFYFKQPSPTDAQKTLITEAFADAWRPINGLDPTPEDRRYELTLQHPEMRRRFLHACVKRDFWTNIEDSLLSLEWEYRALNILGQLHENGEL